ncbi:MAG: hypothetical protein ACI9MU_004311, partial [Alphaproteobacteria bacterium]
DLRDRESCFGDLMVCGHFSFSNTLTDQNGTA